MKIDGVWHDMPENSSWAKTLSNGENVVITKHSDGEIVVYRMTDGTATIVSNENEIESVLKS